MPKTHFDGGHYDEVVLSCFTELTLSHAFVFGVPQYGVFAKSEIAKGTRYGPYRGKIVQTSEIKANDNCSSMWEVMFKNGMALLFTLLYSGCTCSNEKNCNFIYFTYNQSIRSQSIQHCVEHCIIPLCWVTLASPTWKQIGQYESRKPIKSKWL